MLALAVCAVSAAPAGALTQRGYAFEREIGSPGTGAGQMLHPAGVAVSEVGSSKGDVYVVDAGNNRIDIFNAKGEFLEAWGSGVLNGAKELQRCTTETGCRRGLAGHAKGQLHGADAIAVDNNTSATDPSKGDIYVEAVTPFEEEVKGHSIEQEYTTIDKFSPSGTLLRQIKKIKEVKGVGPFSEEIEDPHGLTVAPDGEVWISNETDLIGLTDGEPNRFAVELEPEEVEEGRQGLAVDASGDFYIANEATGGGEDEPAYVGKFGPQGELLRYSLDTENSTGVAVDEQNGDPIVDNVTSLAIFDGSGTLVQRIGEGQLEEGAGVAAVSGGNLYVADSATGKVLSYEPEPEGSPQVDELSVANVTSGSVEMEAELDPVGVETEYTFRYGTGTIPSAGQPCEASCAEAPAPAGKLAAAYGDSAVEETVNGLSPSTVYHYRVIARNAKGEVASAQRAFRTIAAVPGATLPDGRVWEQVSPQAKNGAAIESLSLDGGLIEASENGDALTYIERGALPGAEGNRDPEVTQVFSARGSTGWSSTDLDTPHERAEGITPGSAPEYHAFSANLQQSIVEPFGIKERFEYPPLNASAKERTSYIRSDSAECLVSSAPEACFEPLLKEGEDGDVPSEVEVGGKMVADHFGGLTTFVAANPSFQSIVLSSKIPLTSETAAEAVPPATEETNLYEWSGGKLKLVNVLPSGAPARHAELGVGGATQYGNVVQAISSDGSRLVFSTAVEEDKPQHLYMRDMARGETVQVDAPEAGTETPINAKPVFQAMVQSGSRTMVFFRDEQRLTTDSTASSNHEKPDLYVCEVVENESSHKLECKLKDLTVDHNVGEPAFVQGNVLGAAAGVDEKGDVRVYFVADGALATGASPGTCNPGEETLNTGLLVLPATCNLYMQEYDAETEAWSGPKLIARMSAEDEPDWGIPSKTRLGEFANLTSKVSGNGEWLAFMSDRELTGYDNRDLNSGRHDEEVYLYDTAEEKLICASCNPNGERPTGVLDEEEAGEGDGLLVDRPITWVHRWISGSVPGFTALSATEAPYQSRYLFDNGRLFFTSAEALAPQDVNGKEDVYEYEPPGVGGEKGCTTASESYGETSEGCVSLISSGTSKKESAFLDASANGDDVFFVTSAQLVEADKDTAFDVYDAAICGQPGTSECLPAPKATPPACESAETCHTATYTPPPSLPAATGTTTPAVGNVTTTTTAAQQVLPSKTAKKALTRAQKLAAALKQCRRAHKAGKKRRTCEAQARKRYRSSAKKSSRGSSAKASRR